MINIIHWKTLNNTPVLFVKRQTPMVDINVVFSAGSFLDFEKKGISQLTNAMIKNGSKNLNAEEIASEFESVGAELSANSDRDMGYIGLRSLTKAEYLKKALKMFADILSYPTFPQEDFNRLKKIITAAIHQQEKMPQILARNKFYSAIYQNHPYANSILGTPESLNALTREDLIDFYNRYYVASNALILIVGNITKSTAKEIAHSISSSLKQGGPSPIPDYIQNPVISHQEEKFNFPSQQTYILMGKVAINYHDSDYFPIIVGNSILGGGHDFSRLFIALRDSLGLTYSVNSSIHILSGRGPFILISESKKDLAKLSVHTIKKVLSSFVTNGPTKKELILAKNKIINGFPLKFSNSSAILDSLRMIGFYSLPLDFLNNYCENISQVTSTQIKEAFQEKINPQEMLTVIVGEY